eukprot:CAMPEP_0197526286 /NCGR_PEP_ID=MMETSP1318-20131121/17201_1 /TAXON_ID=552666 /ORGANISM="Partenskyella glossopodia, Strain RCC365" /LENGTH=38 /DNA_ID= /DNA_START= /DNA_END= /DNA_ORIENTATION=
MNGIKDLIMNLCLSSPRVWYWNMTENFGITHFMHWATT